MADTQPVSPFDRSWDFENPRAVGLFLHRCQLYSSRVRGLPKTVETQDQQLIRAADQFIALVAQEDVWHVAQTVVPELRQPIDPKVKNLSWLFRYILEKLQQQHPVQDEVPGTAADSWEEELMLSRIEADIDYSTWSFAYFCQNTYKDKAQARVQRAVEMKQKYRKAYGEVMALSLQSLRAMDEESHQEDSAEADDEAGGTLF